MNNNKIFLTALMILFFVGISSAQKGFIKIGDIKGASVEENHRDWIVMEGFNQAMQKKIAPTPPRRGSATVFNDIVFTKKIDRSTPKLMESCANGMVQPKVEMEMIANNERGQNQTFYKVTLENVLISGISSSSICDPDCEVIEEVSLSFTKISWEHTDSRGQKVVASYDIERGR